MSSERTAECCSTLPRIVPSGYERVGTTKKTPAGLAYYESAQGVTNTDTAVIALFDVVGPNQSQTDQQVDRISKALGFKVVSPHWFGPDLGYPGTLGPGADFNDLWAWVGAHGSPEQVIERTHDIVNTLKSEGYTKLHVIGFCWGGIQAATLATLPDLFVSAGCIHGMAFKPEQAERILVPFLNFPSQNEGPGDDFMAALPAGIKEKSKYKFFDDVPHGFAASRGQWATNELHRQRAEEAIEEYVQFVQAF